MSESSGSPPKKQIRPKVRRTTATSHKGFDRANTTALEVEETRVRMEAWMGLSSGTGGVIDSEVTNSPTCIKEKVTNDEDSRRPPMNTEQQLETSVVDSTTVRSKGGTESKKTTKSILKTPKYTKKSTTLTSSQPTSKRDDTDTGITSTDPTNPPISTSPRTTICKDVIVERDPSKPMLKRKIKPHQPQSAQSNSHSAVEGYVPSIASQTIRSSQGPSSQPQHTHSQNNMASKVQGGAAVATDIPEPALPPSSEAAKEEKTSDPLILNSLEALFDAAGEPLPPPESRGKITADTKLLEADIAFQVMSQDQYQGKLSQLKEQHEQERQAQLQVFMGHHNVFDGEEDGEDGEIGDDSNDDDDEDDLMEMLMGGDLDEEGDEFYPDDGDDDIVATAPEPRAFRLLWDALSDWVTPEAVQYISHLTEILSSESEAAKESNLATWTLPPIERSDVEASRCAGLMAMIKLYLPKCMKELGFPPDKRRLADHRLSVFLRTFNYVHEAPKLPVKLWKGMICVLLEIVLVEQSGSSGSASGIEQEKDPSLVLPASIQAINMTPEEYRYLCRSAISTFALTV